MKLVLVEWVDSHSEGGWRLNKEAVYDADNNDLACETVGWLVEDTDRYILVAGSRTDGRGQEDEVSETMQIPRCAVLRVRSLTPGRSLR